MGNVGCWKRCQRMSYTWKRIQKASARLTASATTIQMKTQAPVMRCFLTASLHINKGVNGVRATAWEDGFSFLAESPSDQALGM